MIVLNNIKKIILKEYFFSIVLGLLLSTLMLGFAISSFFLGFFICASFFRFIIKPVKVKYNARLVLPILLYILFVCSLFWTSSQELTIKGLGKTIAMFLMPLGFMLLPPFSKKNINLVFNIFTKANVLFGLFFIVYSFFRFLKTKKTEVLTYHELVSILDLNAIYVSVFFLLSVAYLLIKKKKTRIDTISLLILIGLILSLSSKTIISCLIVLLFIYYKFFGNFKRKKKINARTIFVSLLLITILLAVSQNVMRRVLFEKQSNIEEVLTVKKVNHIYPWTGTTIRFLQLRFLSEQIKEDGIALTGFGLFASRENLKQRHERLGTYPAYHMYNYHNMYAQIISETGLIGLIILILIIFSNLFSAIRERSFVYLSFSLIMFFWFFTESVLWVQRGLFLFITLHCLFSSKKTNIL